MANIGIEAKPRNSRSVLTHRGVEALKSRPEACFALAGIACGVECFGLGPYEAAKRVAMLLSNLPIDFSAIEDLAIRADVGLSSDVKTRVETLVVKWKRFQGALGPIETAWLSTSATYLGVLIEEARGPSPARMDYALKILDAYGWRSTLEHLVTRVDSADRSNFPPYNGPMSWPVRAFIARLREKR